MSGLFRDWTVHGGELYRGGTDQPERPELSPVEADLHGLPPTYIQVGTNDLLLSDADLLAERARAAGVDVGYARFEGMWHDFQLGAGMLREADEAMGDLASALDDIWAGRSPAESSGPGPDQWPASSGSPTRMPSVAIIGAGFGGIGLAITLKKRGIDSLTILEKGGWRRRCLARQHLPRCDL